MMSFLFGDKQYPCGKCDRECIGKIGRIWPSGNIASLSCSVCNKWYHFTCTDLTEKEFYYYHFFCSRPCEVFLLPFYSCTYVSLVEYEVFTKNEIVTREPAQSENITMPNEKARRKMNYNPFIDIKCEYISPKDLKPYFYR